MSSTRNLHGFRKRRREELSEEVRKIRRKKRSKGCGRATRGLQGGLVMPMIPALICYHAMKNTFGFFGNTDRPTCKSVAYFAGPTLIAGVAGVLSAPVGATLGVTLGGIKGIYDALTDDSRPEESLSPLTTDQTKYLKKLSFLDGLHRRAGARSPMAKCKKKYGIFDVQPFRLVFALAGLVVEKNYRLK